MKEPFWLALGALGLMFVAGWLMITGVGPVYVVGIAALSMTAGAGLSALAVFRLEECLARRDMERFLRDL